MGSSETSSLESDSPREDPKSHDVAETPDNDDTVQEPQQMEENSGNTLFSEEKFCDYLG